MTALSAILGVSFPVGVIMASVNWKIALAYSAALVIQYLALATSARNYGTRFALDVLAEESHSK